MDIGALRLTEVATIEREPDPGMRFIHFVDHHDLVLGIYEAGVICMNKNGQVLWNAFHGEVGVHLLGFRKGVVWLEYQWPDTMVGTRFGYRLEDGRQVDPTRNTGCQTITLASVDPGLGKPAMHAALGQTHVTTDLGDRLA